MKGEAAIGCRRCFHIGTALLLVLVTLLGLSQPSRPVAAASTGPSYVGMVANPIQTAYQFAGNIGPIDGALGNTPFVSSGEYSIEAFLVGHPDVGDIMFGWI